MKIRTDFVTNSSSSSYILAIRVVLKNGEVLKFVGDSDGEAVSTYRGLTPTAMPGKLGRSKSIESLIMALKESIVQTRRGQTSPVLTDDDPLISGLGKVSSMNEIDCVTVNMDAYGYDEEYGYAHYTYYRDRKITVFDEGGEDRPCPFAFVPDSSMVRADDFGECEDDGYKQGSDWDTPMPGEKRKPLKNDDGYFNIKDGVLVKYIGKDRHVIIPEGVERIGEGACGYTEMESVVIPEGVKAIEDYAFDSCTDLEEVTLPSSIEEIGEEAFAGCWSIKKFNGPERVVELAMQGIDDEEDDDDEEDE